MKNFAQSLVFITLFLLITSTCFAYDGPGTIGGIFPIGWSEKGDIFAFGYYIGGHYPGSSEMVVIVQNMVNDSTLFSHTKTWAETYRGDEFDTHLPQSPQHAWNQISELVNEKLTYYNIMSGNYFLNSFPNGDLFDAEIRPFSSEPGYGLYIKLDDGKEKMITVYSEELSVYDMNNIIQGFVMGPYEKRMAVIVRFEAQNGEPFDSYRAYGCHMKVGFKLTPK